MDLLMHLIEKNKIDIYDIPMAVLTEQYMDYLGQMQEFDIEVASEFIVMAATLLQIKSRMMLPKPPKTEEAEEEDDPRKELVERILEYRRFRRVSVELDVLAALQERVFAPWMCAKKSRYRRLSSRPTPTAYKERWKTFFSLLIEEAEKRLLPLRSLRAPARSSSSLFLLFWS